MVDWCVEITAVSPEDLFFFCDTSDCTVLFVDGVDASRVTVCDTSGCAGSTDVAGAGETRMWRP